ncbi:MAG: superoxide dismutase family protein [Desulfobacterales bacterium]
MKRYTASFISAAILALLLTFAAGVGVAEQHQVPVDRAVAVLHPTEGNRAGGKVMFSLEDDGVRVKAEIEGLPPGKHGFHIHEFGDCTAPDATSAGGHYDPEGHPHAGPDHKNRHMGDLGNLEADESGRAGYDRVDNLLVLDGPKSIIGHAVIVHADEDDFTSQPTGNAGARLACGVIGISEKADE